MTYLVDMITSGGTITPTQPLGAAVKKIVFRKNLKMTKIKIEVPGVVD